MKLPDRVVSVRRVGLFAIAAFSVAAAACSSASDWQGTIEERDGVVYVSSPAAGLWQGREPAPIRFELEQVFGVEAGADDAMLGFVRGVAVDGAGDVYLFDQQRNRLVAFDAEGNLRWAVGQEGQGPEDFFRVRGIVWDGGSSLLVANQGGTRLDTWGLDGVYRTTVPLTGLGEGISNLSGFIPPDRLVFSSFIAGGAGTNIAVVRLGEPLERVAGVTVKLYPDLAMPASVGVGVDVRVADGKIVVGHDGEYVLRIYDESSALERVVTRDVDDLVRVGVHMIDGRRGGVASFSALNAPLRLPTGHWLTSAYWPTDIDDPDEEARRVFEAGQQVRHPYRNSVDVFDPDGRHLFSIVRDGGTRPEIGDLALVGPDGKLYTSLSDPFPQVRRYRVEIDN